MKAKIKLKNIDHFNELLARMGYNHNQFSKVAGMSLPMVSLISKGKRSPSPKMAKKITEALALPWDDLFEFEK